MSELERGVYWVRSKNPKYPEIELAEWRGSYWCYFGSTYIEHQEKNEVLSPPLTFTIEEWLFGRKGVIASASATVTGALVDDIGAFRFTEVETGVLKAAILWVRNHIVAGIDSDLQDAIVRRLDDILANSAVSVADMQKLRDQFPHKPTG